MVSNRQKNSRTITPSQKKRANQEADPPPGPRKGKKRRNSRPKSPSSSETSSNEGEEPVAPPARKQGLDPVNCEFTLQRTIYLDGQRIAGTSKQYKLGHLTFPVVWQESIDKAGDAAERLQNTDNWGLEVSLATISAARMKPIVSDVMERSDWDEIEEIVKSLYLDKRTFIRVNWDLYYQALAPTDTPTEESSSNPPPSQSNRPSNVLIKPNGSGRKVESLSCLAI